MSERDCSCSEQCFLCAVYGLPAGIAVRDTSSRPIRAHRSSPSAVNTYGAVYEPLLARVREKVAQGH